ncbi:alpha-glucosidase-like [Neodiprion virginianus]|uniref:alpha-glucosidase-like n=1 Tax=Neodiprion virginianus TaxID=2961670 RepID=UPI001EE72208|nr:alpha-glucosidase-like [Neodiprion virginianus]
MCTLPVLFLILAGTASIDATTYNVTTPTEWWQTAVIYEIWPESFKDSNGDGIGDFNGITSTLSHFVDMGVTCIWLAPIYESPFVDSGYDISDFYALHSTYGTLDDFTTLVKTAQELGLKVIIDFVPNHTSDEHEWFVKAKQGIEPYYSYYIWNEGIMYGDYRGLPSNWISGFTGSTWEWVDERNAYYLHQFSKHEVDLNWRNPDVMEQMKKVLTYWLDLGIDGFRVDAVPFFVESANFTNETLSGQDVPSDTYYYLNHTETKDQPESYPLVQEWKEHINNYTVSQGNDKVRVMCTEGYSAIDYVVKWYDYGSDVPFNFFFISDGQTSAVIDTATDIVDIITKWYNNMPSYQTANWVLGNHDRSRIATKVGLYRTDGIHFLILLMSGVPTLYFGDEIGMTDTFLTWAETTDVQACNTNETEYLSWTRDPERTPYQWDNTTAAGFSTNSTPFLKVNENYLTVNLAAEKEADFSHYKNFQKAIALRNTTVWREGTVDVELIEDDVIGMSRQLDGEDPIIVLVNWANTTVTVDLDSYFADLPDTMELVIADMYSGLNDNIGDTYNKSSMYIPAYGAMVLLGTSS